MHPLYLCLWPFRKVIKITSPKKKKALPKNRIQQSSPSAKHYRYLGNSSSLIIDGPAMAIAAARRLLHASNFVDAVQDRQEKQCRRRQHRRRRRCVLKPRPRISGKPFWRRENDDDDGGDVRIFPFTMCHAMMLSSGSFCRFCCRFISEKDNLR